jgi:hypothetical protein
MFVTSCGIKELAPRGGFEPPTFRLTAEQPTSSELAGVGHNRRKSASCDATKPDESFSPSLFTFRSHFAAIHRHWYYVFMAARTVTDLDPTGYGVDPRPCQAQIRVRAVAAVENRLHRTVRRRSQLEVAPSTEKSHRPPPTSTSQSESRESS